MLASATSLPLVMLNLEGVYEGTLGIVPSIVLYELASLEF